jgi:hypothetical protein
MSRRPFDTTERTGHSWKVKIGSMSGFVTVNTNDAGEPREVFIHGFGTHGNMLQGWSDSFAVMLSIALQHDVTLSELALKFTGQRVEPYGETDDPRVPYCWSIPDYIMQRLVLDHGDDELKSIIKDKLEERRRKV